MSRVAAKQSSLNQWLSESPLGKLIERDVLDALCSEVGGQTMLLLLRSFQNDLDRRTPLLAQLQVNDRAREIAHHAHVIRGLAATFGALSLSSRCQAVEDAAREGLPATDSLVLTMTKEAQRLQRALSAADAELARVLQ